MTAPVKLTLLTVRSESERWLCVEASGLRSTNQGAILRARRLYAWWRSDRKETPDPWDVHWLFTIAQEQGTLRSAWAATLLQEFPQPSRRRAV